MVELVIHCDYHPGNCKFDGEQVIGLFDFDWSKVDLRCYDVAMALWYFFACWDPERDGSLRLEDIELFLVSYQDVLKKRPGLAPLTNPELDCLSPMISAANLYVLNWTLHDFLNKEIDEKSYLGFLQHHMNTIRWLDNPTNQEKLKRILKRASCELV
jgi:homoserine kinase type II